MTLQKCSGKGGFTLVEIMIVVAIIAILATLAAPAIIRARQRSQATVVLDHARSLSSALDQYAIEHSRAGSDPVTFSDIQPYLRPGTRIHDMGGQDVTGGTYVLDVVQNGVRIDPATLAKFDPSIIPDNFWDGYKD